MAETWDESKPAGSRRPKLGDDDIREFKRGIRERLAEDHWFSATESPAFGATGYKIGKHKHVTFKQYDTAKTTLSDEIALRCKDVSGSKEIIMTPPSAGTDRQLTKSGGQSLNLDSSDFANGIIPTGAHATKGINANSSLEEIADFGIKTAQLNTSAVTTSKIASFAVGASQLNTSSVTAAKVGTGAVETAKIADNGVTPAKTSHGSSNILQLPSDSIGYTSTQTSWQTVANFRLKMPSGPTAIGGSAYIWNSDGSDEAYCRISVGGQNSGAATRESATPAWTSFASVCNVSGLTPGTEYTVSIQIYTENGGGDTAHLDGLSLWWE